MIWQVVIALVGGLLLLWVAFVVVLWRASPGDARVSDAVRLLPDLLRLVGRLARDGSLPRAVRIRLWLLLAYLASPIDLVPDFLPVIGYADDAIIVALVLRSTIKHAGTETLARHWTGTEQGLETLLRLCRVPGRPPDRS